MRLGPVLLMIAIGARGIYGQTPLRFEEASIRPSKAVDNSSRLGPGPQGGLRAENITTGQLISFAFGVRSFQVDGAPKWVETERWDILATPEKAEEQPNPGMSRDRLEGFIARMRQRVLTMLKERYGLSARADMKEMPVYSLVVRKGGHKLTESAPGLPPNMSTGRGTMKGSGANMKMLADALSGVLYRPVVDNTGLTGLFDLKMEWTPDTQAGPDAPAAEPTGASLFTAIQEQLGLRLEATKAPAPVVVVEKIERPSEN